MLARLLLSLVACLLSGSILANQNTSVSDLLQEIEASAKSAHSSSLLILHGDKVLLEQYSTPSPKALELMSVTKSVVALAIGCLVTDGKIKSLDTPVHEYYPEWKQGRKQQITLRMLMDHTSGLQNSITTDEIYPAPNVVQLALSAELSHDPGSHYAYNNKATNLLAGIVSKLSGESLDSYMQSRLFNDLGIQPGKWMKDEAGNPHVMAGLALTARDLATIGRLVNHRGQFAGKQLLASEFIDSMLAASAKTRDGGLLWWRYPAWVRFHADDASFALLERKGVRASLIDQLRPLNGRRFDSPEALYAALEAQLGSDWRQTWANDVTRPHGLGPWAPFHSEKGPYTRFEGNGWLGQYLVIVPHLDLVAVRQFEAVEERPEGHDYDAFSEQIGRLATALE
ncbi:serine hydrolase domain-containing protein [Pseudomarimonas arenosa]|uniref:Serine hydrolase n=1 Tax=Pseudomarimonas arenosa TaxID=2774145 RepID=A0AAW3ZLP8_9GAMM|nr:serine hydrolase [Pseudomarimonas arenosa]MBD8526385.1 serine hydrolase [Pseudomarimonas arenosa]